MKGKDGTMNRESKIQSLLRHAFICLAKSKCSCSKNIQKFLQTDKKSLEWVKEKLYKNGRLIKITDIKS